MFDESVRALVEFVKLCGVDSSAVPMIVLLPPVLALSIVVDGMDLSIEGLGPLSPCTAEVFCVLFVPFISLRDRFRLSIAIRASFS